MSIPNLSTWAAKPITMLPSKSKLIGFNLTGIWPLGGLTGTPTISVVAAGVNAPLQTYTGGAVVASGDITFGAPVVNVATFKDDAGQTVGIGFGVQCQVTSSAVDGGNYTLVVGASDGTSSDGLFIMLEIRGAGQPAP